MKKQIRMKKRPRMSELCGCSAAAWCPKPINSEDENTFPKIRSAIMDETDVSKIQEDFPGFFFF